jgi:hypothetical protein
LTEQLSEPSGEVTQVKQIEQRYAYFSWIGLKSEKSLVRSFIGKNIDPKSGSNKTLPKLASYSNPLPMQCILFEFQFNPAVSAPV